MTICAIHQPNFFPWAGYFDKIKNVDVFIFLDEVAHPKSGSGSWCNRVKLLKGGVPSWYGLPIKRQSGVHLIKDVEFLDKDYNVKKILKSLEYQYKKSPHYDIVISLVEPLLLYPTNSLVNYNINAITQIARHFGFKTKFILQSDLEHNLQSTNLLIELLKQVGADTYLCGNGCNGYQEDELFKKEGIELIYQSENPARNFVKGINDDESKLSILHILMLYYGYLGIDIVI